MPGLTSVVVVAADSGPLLRECVERVLASRSAVELVLVDNASTDGEPQRVVAAHAGDERLHVLHNVANLGFGPACNRGAVIARGDALLFLNPDCLIEPETIACLRGAADADAAIGVLGVMVCAPDGRPARGNRRREPTLKRALMTLSGLARLESRWPVFAGVEMPCPAPAAEVRCDVASAGVREAASTDAQTETVEAVSGACLMVPRAVFGRLRGFDEDYFLHCEDLDLCRRARDAGRRVAIARDVRVRHLQGSSSRSRPWFVSRHKHRGMWRYFRKFDPAARNPLLRGLVWCGIWVHFALTAPLAALKRNGRYKDGAIQRLD
ncbi:MAG TPA: glycosyltransferase family 2 protein [Rhodanobacteraceae bacterium]|nr:glycosyltransferase family 2 protein [Rhodanobacteraceae bacterium]